MFGYCNCAPNEALKELNQVGNGKAETQSTLKPERERYACEFRVVGQRLGVTTALRTRP